MKEEIKDLEKKIELLEKEVKLLEQIFELYTSIEKKKYYPDTIPVMYPYYPYYPYVTYTTNAAELSVEDKIRNYNLNK